MNKLIANLVLLIANSVLLIANFWLADTLISGLQNPVKSKSPY